MIFCIYNYKYVISVEISKILPKSSHVLPPSLTTKLVSSLQPDADGDTIVVGVADVFATSAGEAPWKPCTSNGWQWSGA